MSENDLGKASLRMTDYMRQQIEKEQAERLPIDNALDAFKTWVNASNAETERLAAKLLWREIELLIARPATVAQGYPEAAMPVYGSAPVPVCYCGHSRTEHLMNRGECGIIECVCKEFKKNLAPNLVSR